MGFVKSLQRRIGASEPCCIVCGKRLKIADATQVQLVDRLNVLACPAHAPIVEVLKRGTSKLGQWLWQRYGGAIHGQR